MCICCLSIHLKITFSPRQFYRTIFMHLHNPQAVQDIIFTALYYLALRWTLKQKSFLLEENDFFFQGLNPVLNTSQPLQNRITQYTNQYIAKGRMAGIPNILSNYQIPFYYFKNIPGRMPVFLLIFEPISYYPYISSNNT